MFIGEIMRVRTCDYLATSPLDLGCMPRLRPPATSVQIEELESLADQPLDPDYRKFLSLTDGLDGFHYSTPLMGFRDWEDPQRRGLAVMFRDVTLEAGPLEEVGLSEGTRIFPMYVNAQGSAGMLMLQADDTDAGRYWWTGAGDNMLFRTFREAVTYMMG
ncbi:SMI1/KNR4 family protein [Streptomyces sp. NPDC003247]|uniref:SMI1/KNR4 family protein n=1 Tax=Streptomyces sp. NPDC003247 TaxID=3364677 RepID=UPI0036CB83D9